MEASVDSLKKVFLELGGKSGVHRLDDADLGGACSMAGFAVATHAGQGCAITTRLLVPAREARARRSSARPTADDYEDGLAADDSRASRAPSAVR